MSWGTYDRLLKVYGATTDEIAVNQAKETFLLEAVENPDYYPDCKRNGEPQRFLIERTDVPYKAKFVTFPDEEIYPGDLIEVRDLIYILIEPPRFLDKINWAAVGRLCNLDLHWQDFDGNILTCPVCLDAGVYSTTLNGTDTVQAPDKQFKLYLPYNEDTATLHLDQRIAVDTRFDKHGKTVLECYRITGMNRVAKTYGKGGHLLICELRSSTYSEEHDNLELMICDYKPLDRPPDVPSDLPCSIDGRKQVRIGGKQQYTAHFYNADGDEAADIVASWSLPESPLVMTADGNSLTVKVPKNEDLIGNVYVVHLGGMETDVYSLDLEIEVIP